MFGAYVKSLRKSKGIGSRELARKINKAGTYISQLERGLIKKPDFNTSKLMLEILGLSSSDIQEVLRSYGVLESNITVNKVTNKLTTKDEYESKCKSDAQEVFKLINSLPERTQDLLKDMILKQ